MDLAAAPLPDRTLVTVMEQALRECPDRVALSAPGASLTYQESWTAGLRIGGGLRALGVQRQEQVLLMLDTHLDNVLAWLGLVLTGGVEVSVNTAAKGTMLSHVAADSGANVLLVEEQYLPRLLDVAGQLPHLTTLVVRPDPGGRADEASLRAAADRWRVVPFGEVAAGEPVAPVPVDPWDLASISYTSGTTGRSKGVACPHAHAYGHATNVGIGTTRPGEIRFVVLPQFHIAGRWGGVYNALATRATAHLADGFHATTFWDEIRAAGAHTTELVGSMAEFVYRQPPCADDRDHPLREVSMIPLIPAAEDFKQRFGVTLTTCFGGTEIGCVTEVTNASIKTGSGALRSGYEARIVDEWDREVPDGQAGELVVRPELPWTTMIGYHGMPAETAAAWRNGWLHSGDALYRDESGNYFFVDRVDDAIRRRGENISSAEVEAHLNEHPAVLESAAVAVPSEYGEDEIKAVVVLREGHGVSEAELVLELAERMPRYMVPRYVQFTTGLPRTPTAKVRKKVLRQAGVGGAWDRDAANIVLPR